MELAFVATGDSFFILSPADFNFIFSNSLFNAFSCPDKGVKLDDTAAFLLLLRSTTDSVGLFSGVRNERDLPNDAFTSAELDSISLNSLS